MTGVLPSPFCSIRSMSAEGRFSGWNAHPDSVSADRLGTRQLIFDGLPRGAESLTRLLLNRYPLLLSYPRCA